MVVPFPSTTLQNTFLRFWKAGTSEKRAARPQPTFCLGTRILAENCQLRFPARLVTFRTSITGNLLQIGATLSARGCHYSRLAIALVIRPLRLTIRPSRLALS